jgi:hypothetical protein
MYRELDLTREQDFSRYASYAGPTWTSRSLGPTGGQPEVRLWACDRCRGGSLYHERGITVLFADSARTETIRSQDFPGLLTDGQIRIGPESPVELFRRVVFPDGGAVRR